MGEPMRGVSPCAGCIESDGDCSECKENALDLKGSDLASQLATANRALSDVNIEIARQEKLKLVWQKIAGSLEFQIYGRICP